jgi:hypothetical protein
MRLAALLILFLPLGCTSTVQVVAFPDQAKRVEDPAKARIYVVRPTYAGGAHSMAIHDDGVLVGHTGPVGFLCWERAPGATTLEGKAANTAQLALTVEAGTVSYVLQGMYRADGAFTVNNGMELLSEAEGVEILGDCDPPEIESP